MAEVDLPMSEIMELSDHESEAELLAYDHDVARLPFDQLFQGFNPQAFDGYQLDFGPAVERELDDFLARDLFAGDPFFMLDAAHQRPASPAVQTPPYDARHVGLLASPTEAASMDSAPGSTYDTPINLDHLDSPAPLTMETCLHTVLEVLPDISHDHVRELYNNAPPHASEGEEWIQAFIGNILERDVKKNLKRKRDEEAARIDGSEGEENIDAGDKTYKDAA
jgi:hypothetical protein